MLIRYLGPLPRQRRSSPPRFRVFADTETRMVAVFDELHLTELVCSIVGISTVGAIEQDGSAYGHHSGRRHGA